jgi:hypothetical protein
LTFIEARKRHFIGLLGSVSTSLQGDGLQFPSTFSLELASLSFGNHYFATREKEAGTWLVASFLMWEVLITLSFFIGRDARRIARRNVSPSEYQSAAGTAVAIIRDPFA